MIIAKADKFKIESFSTEILEKALLKCNEGASYLNQALEEKSNLLLIKALDSFQESIRIYSRRIEPYMALAYISFQMGKKTEAIKFISKALEIEPKNQKANKLFIKIISNKKLR